jgi:hypothetical protein|nr:DUF4433 domain-containing protein [uncultured Dongia sp.]
MPAPAHPKIYHIVHVDKLASIVADGCLFSDAEVRARQRGGTTVGMSDIKERRLKNLKLSSHPDLYIGQCVPFYFCPRSVMLYLLHKGNHPGITYKGGQGPIVHLECDLHESVEWAGENDVRWAFTLSNAGAYYFEDCCDLDDLNQIQWDAVAAYQWAGQYKEGKQAEFLMETYFPWHLVRRIGVHSAEVAQKVAQAMGRDPHRPIVELRQGWYY